MFFKESDNFLSKDNIFFIENVVLKDNFPFFISLDSVKGDKANFLYHCLLKRPEDRINEKDINSNFFEETVDIVYSFFKKINIKHKKILRLAINFTYNNGFKKCPIHRDHEYKHRQLIIYLNNAEESSKTVILNDANKILKKITPKKYKGICFDDSPHYQFYPKFGNRVVLVCTFI